MGIAGLLPALKEIQVHGNIADFKGKRLAVDAYVWLHKGAFGCAEELVKGKKTTKFVDYAMYRVRLLRHHGIEPYVVFDGGPLPAKKKTESSREKSRKDSLARAQSLEGQGRLRDARDAYTKCVDITPEMAFQLIKALRAENVDYVVAPYEADAQLCFLEREGYVEGIITEDSDLLVFGCQHVIFKLESSGQCVSIKADKLAMVREMPMHGWTDVQFRRMAMLSGCDYLDSIPGIGLKTAHRLLRRHKTVEKVVQMLRLEGTLNVPPNYIKAFAQAELAFLHQRVFDPRSKKLVPLNAFPAGGLSDDDEKWVGLVMELHTARGVARGDLHPETRSPIEDMCPDYQPSARNGVQRGVGTPAQVPKAKVAGPMDAFISKNKVIKPLPIPVGQLGSGVSRLSERNINAMIDPPAAAIKKSKFFGATAKKEIRQEEVIELHWEPSDGPEAQAGPTRSQSRSPSPIPSVHSVISPVKAVEESLTHLTSPVAPDCSSPAMSSPPHADIETQPLTSPRPACQPPGSRSRSRSITPASQTRNARTPNASVLIPSTSQIPVVSQTPVAIPSTSSPVPAKYALPAPGLTTSTFSNHPSSSSSDSTFSDEVVTPSLPSATDTAKRCRPPAIKRESLGKRSRSDENDSDQEVNGEDVMRAEKAKVIAKDWRLKYAFGGAHTPVIRPAKGKRSVSDNPTPTLKARTPIPLSATMPRILSCRPDNIPDTPLPTHGGIDKPKRVDLVAAPPSSSPASDTSMSRLDRFKFTGKIDTRQTSSPSL